MPIYEYLCKNCGLEFDRAVPMSQYSAAQMCPQCDQPATKLVSKPNIQMDYPPYTCPITGKVVEGRKAHAANLREHGCRVLETGEMEAARRRREQGERDFDRMVEESAAREVAALPPEKLNKLIREAESSPDVQIVRQGV